MRGWRPHLSYLWADRRDGIVAVLLCLGICGVIFAAIYWAVHPDLREPLLAPAEVSETEGTIVGFVNTDNKFRTSGWAYVRTISNAYVLVRMPFLSGCHGGDHVFLTEQRSGGRTAYRLRDPTCPRRRSNGDGRR